MIGGSKVGVTGGGGCGREKGRVKRRREIIGRNDSAITTRLGLKKNRDLNWGGFREEEKGRGVGQDQSQNQAYNILSNLAQGNLQPPTETKTPLPKRSPLCGAKGNTITITRDLY